MDGSTTDTPAPESRKALLTFFPSIEASTRMVQFEAKHLVKGTLIGSSINLGTTGYAGADVKTAKERSKPVLNILRVYAFARWNHIRGIMERILKADERCGHAPVRHWIALRTFH